MLVVGPQAGSDMRDYNTSGESGSSGQISGPLNYICFLPLSLPSPAGVSEQENKKTPRSLGGTIHCLVESCLCASYKYAEALQAHFNYCIGERGREGGGRVQLN